MKLDSDNPMSYVLILAVVGIVFALAFPFLRRADYAIRSQPLVEQTVKSMVRPECLVGSSAAP